MAHPDSHTRPSRPQSHTAPKHAQHERLGDLIAQLEPEKKDLTDWYKREWWLVVTLASGVPAAAALAVPRTYGKYFIAASVALVAIGMIMLVIREVRKPATSRE